MRPGQSQVQNTFAIVHLRSFWHHHFTYLKLKPEVRFVSKKFFIIAGIPHHHIGKIRIISWEDLIFFWIIFLTGSSPNSLWSSNSKKSCLYSLSYKFSISTFFQAIFAHLLYALAILWVNHLVLGWAVIIRVFTENK